MDQVYGELDTPVGHIAQDDIEAAELVNPMGDAGRSQNIFRMYLNKFSNGLRWFPSILLSLVGVIWTVRSLSAAEQANRLSMMESCRAHPVIILFPEQGHTKRTYLSVEADQALQKSPICQKMRKDLDFDDDTASKETSSACSTSVNSVC